MNESFEELDGLPCDLTAYLQRRLGVDRHTAESVLADWIAEYEPTSLHPVHLLERGRRDAPDVVLEASAA